MKQALFIFAVIVLLLATAVLLYPSSDGPWTGFIVTTQGKFVADSSHRTLNECRKYVQSHSGGMCGLDCGDGTSCKKSVNIPDLYAQ